MSSNDRNDNLNGMQLTQEQIESLNRTLLNLAMCSKIHLDELKMFRILGGFQEEINSGSTRVYNNEFNSKLRSSFLS